MSCCNPFLAMHFPVNVPGAAPSFGKGPQYIHIRGPTKKYDSGCAGEYN